MKTTTQIVELLKTEPNLSANQIIEKLNVRADSTKQTLYHLHKRGKIKREKAPIRTEAKSGPKNIYIYSV